ncbi:PAS domain-containing sensor histidine kinase [Parabacteroides distasonis]
MGKYDHLSKEELIQRIERLEADLEKATLTPSASDNELEMRQSQHTINFLNILMDTILSNVFVEIMVKDIFNGFRYIYFNKAAEEFTGVKAEDILGKTDFELFPDSRRAHEIRTEDYHTIKTGRMVKEMVEYEKPNGEVRIVNIVRLLITNPDPGASPLLLVMLNDITEQRQDQLALMKVQEADKMKNAFIANMSHEIRTPLNAIVGFAHLVTETTNASEQREYFSIINKNCDLLLKLINDILDLSKIESGRLNYNVSEVELRDICQEAYVVQSLKMTSDVALLYNSVAMPSVRLWIDPHRVEQVLLNLLSNAIKFTSKGFISLFYEVEDMFVRVSVMDTGIGISEEKLESVFERFVKLDDFYQGAGLGLPICKMIVEQLGGEIGVRSELGKGSTFWFTLPLVVTDKAVVEKDDPSVLSECQLY